MDPVDTVMELAAVDRDTAVAALAQHKEIWVAVDALLTKPMVAGDRFIPPPPTVDNGLTPEQDAICRRGRWLQDQVNVVFSVAHSKIRTLPDEVPQEAPAHAEAPPSSPEHLPVSSVVVPELPPGSDAQTTQ